VAIVVPPTEAGFLQWVRSVMGVTTQQLPDNDPVIPVAYEVAIEIVNQTLNQASPTIYALAVYNLGGSNLVNYAQDQTDQTFWTDLRSKFNTYGFVAGVISSSSDEGTSETLLVPDALKGLTLSNLQYLKDPWGRQYLSFAQLYGPNIWGLS
jgi:uncharacterized protein YciU (UPF0263 family)